MEISGFLLKTDLLNIEEYRKKRQGAQLKEATELVRLYRERYGKEPEEDALHEFFYLFTNADVELPKKWKTQMALMGNEEYSYKVLRDHTPMFADMEQFLKSIK